MIPAAGWPPMRRAPISAVSRGYFPLGHHEVIHDGLFGANFKYEDAAAPGQAGRPRDRHAHDRAHRALAAGEQSHRSRQRHVQSFLLRWRRSGGVGRTVARRHEQRSHDGRECRGHHDSRLGRRDGELRLGRLRAGHHHQYAWLRRERDPLLRRLDRRENQSGRRNQVRLGGRHHHRRQRTSAHAGLVQLLAEQQ